MKMFSLEFENLGKAFSKAKSVIEKEGSIPQFFIRGLSDLEDFVKEVSLVNTNCRGAWRKALSDVW